jgi:hypothetical protein
VGQPKSEPLPKIVEEWGQEEWDIDRVLDSKRGYRKLHNFLQWAGYSHIRTSWDTAENVDYAQELINEFHPKHPGKQRS